MGSALPLIIIVLLILINAFFVAAEFALVGVSPATIERRAIEGHRTAQRILRILRDPTLQDRYIATAQIGITLASLGLGMYGEHTLAQWLYDAMASVAQPSWLAIHTLASVLSVAILTYFHILLGEMVPKSVALVYAERSVFAVAGPMAWTQVIIYPLVIGLNALGNLVLKWCHIERPNSSRQCVTQEELDYLVEESRHGGMLPVETARILTQLLEFGDLTAGEVMVPRVEISGIPIGSTSEELREIVLRTRHSRYPVFDGSLDDVVGMVHIKDIFKLISNGATLTSDFVRVVPHVPHTSRVDAVLDAMRRRKTHLAVVMDEFGGTAGLVTIEDLFEEVIGDVEGGPGGSEPGQVQVDQAIGLQVPGTMRLEEVGDLLGVDLEHEEVLTVSGLVLALLGRRPKVGDVVVYDNVKFQVTRLRGHGVNRCLVTLLRDEKGSAEDT